MNKNLAILFSVLVLVVISGITYAADEKDAATEDTATEEPVEKPITYGQCVSEHAVIKNTCYATVKDALNTCKAQVPQDASKKDATKQCKQTYKKDKQQCKVTFKASKKECTKIKHNVFETMGSAFK